MAPRSCPTTHAFPGYLPQESEREQLLQCMAGLLHLGNIEFDDGSGAATEPQPQPSTRSITPSLSITLSITLTLTR